MSEPTALGHVCPYCNADAVPTTGRHVYPKRPDLASLRFASSRAPSATRASGATATTGARSARSRTRTFARCARCHNAFDKIWQLAPPRWRDNVRRGAYVWLACELGVQAAHFGHMDEAQAGRALTLLYFGAETPSMTLLRELGLQEEEDAEGFEVDQWFLDYGE